MGTIEILSPAALGPSDAKPLAPRRATLARRRPRHPRRPGVALLPHATPTSWPTSPAPSSACATSSSSIPTSRIGAPEAESGKVVDFARQVDAAVVGLGT